MELPPRSVRARAKSVPSNPPHVDQEETRLETLLPSAASLARQQRVLLAEDYSGYTPLLLRKHLSLFRCRGARGHSLGVAVRNGGRVARSIVVETMRLRGADPSWQPRLAKGSEHDRASGNMRDM